MLLNEEFANWIHDDITWCAEECSHTECERHLNNKINKTGFYSAAMFRNTETCPLNDKKREHEAP